MESSWGNVEVRVIMARLKLTCQWQRRCNKTFLTFICAYAMTARPLLCRFLEQLQDNALQGDILVQYVGGMNVRVGVLDLVEGCW